MHESAWGLTGQLAGLRSLRQRWSVDFPQKNSRDYKIAILSQTTPQPKKKTLVS